MEMDEETRKKIEAIKVKYRGNPDIEFLLLKLSDADVMAMMVDVAIGRRILDPRSGIADSRLSYGTPWEYEFAPRRLLLGYQGGIEEVIKALSAEHP